MRRNDSRQSSDFRLNSCRQSTDNIRLNSCRHQSPQILSLAKDENAASADRRSSFDGLSTKKVKDQFCGSTPILFSKQKLNGIGGSASPTPHPRSRRARSEAEHRAGKNKQNSFDSTILNVTMCIRNLDLTLVKRRKHIIF